MSSNPLSSSFTFISVFLPSLYPSFTPSPPYGLNLANLQLPTVQLARWTSRSLGSTWPGCTTSTCSSPASMSWSPGKSLYSTPSSSPPSLWRSTPHMSLCPYTCASLWSFSLGSLATSLRAPWHSWTERGGQISMSSQIITYNSTLKAQDLFSPSSCWTAAVSHFS